MQVIKHYELASAQSSIVFSDIPQTYTDLYLVVSARGTISNDQNGFVLQPNGSSDYTSARYLRGSGSGASSFNDSSWARGGLINSSGATANTFASTQIYIPNYASTTTYKSFSAESVAENNATSAYQYLTAGLYASNTAITSLTLNGSYLYGGNFVQYSSATLFGILAGSDGTTTVS